MKNRILQATITALFLSFVGESAQVLAADHSSLRINLSASDGGESKALLLITDQNGRRIGGIKGLTEFAEIAGGSCGIDALDNDEEEGEASPESIECEILHGLLNGTYLITLSGRESVKYYLHVSGSNINWTPISNEARVYGYIVAGATLTYSVAYDPMSTQGISRITKSVSASSLAQDIKTAASLSQIGDDKFIASLLKQVDLAAMLISSCNKHKAIRSNGYKSASDVLRLFVKRLELANRKCDNAGGCDEGPELAAFEKAHRVDRDYDEFFRAWGKDDWHKWKKTAKRFVTDEALGIIHSDAEVLIKTLEPSPKEPEKH